MSTLDEIEEAIEKLPPDALRKLRDWIVERDSEEWDAQIERDAAEGKFDVIRKGIFTDDDAGQCVDL